MVSNAKRTKLQSRIAELQEKLSALDEKVVVNSKSEGFPELISQLNKVLKLHKIETVEAIEILLKAKRTGLTLISKQ